MAPLRLSREEILERYRACHRRLGRVPGWAAFCRNERIYAAQILYYWPRIGDLAREAGVTPNYLTPPRPEEELFQDYAQICFRLGKIPNAFELRVANRELGTHATSAFTRFGGIAEFDRRFLGWLIHGEEKFKPLISMPGWQRKGHVKRPAPPVPAPYPFPFLPVALQDLEKLARGKESARGADEEPPEDAFRTRCAEAFRALGFEITQLLPSGRAEEARYLGEPFDVALPDACRYAVLLEPRARAGGFRPPTSGTEFLARACCHAMRLQVEGIAKTHLVFIGPSFRETHLATMVQYLEGSGIAGITLLSATALMRLVAESIHDRAHFTLERFEATLAGNSLIR